MRNVIHAIALLATLFVLPAKAELRSPSYDSVDISIRSYHVSKRCYNQCQKKFNESNYGIGITKAFTRNTEFSIGFLQNSFDQLSFYGVANFNRLWHTNSSIVFKPGLALGLANGYEDTPSRNVIGNGIVPVISPNISIFAKKLHFNVGLLPSANTAVLIFRAGVRF